jgi:hypothetical protein
MNERRQTVLSVTRVTTILPQTYWKDFHWSYLDDVIERLIVSFSYTSFFFNPLKQSRDSELCANPCTLAIINLYSPLHLGRAHFHLTLAKLVLYSITDNGCVACQML